MEICLLPTQFYCQVFYYQYYEFKDPLSSRELAIQEITSKFDQNKILKIFQRPLLVIYENNWFRIYLKYIRVFKPSRLL